MPRRLSLVYGLAFVTSSTCLAQTWLGQSMPEHPFQADFTQTIVSTRVDGSATSSNWHGQLARDASGRTMEHKQKDGDPSQTVYGEVNDPVARLEIEWSSRDRVAIVTHYSEEQAASVGGYFAKILPTPGICNSRSSTSAYHTASADRSTEAGMGGRLDTGGTGRFAKEWIGSWPTASVG